MAAVSSMRAIVLEERERTKGSSKADIERFIEESESRILSLESQIRALVELRDRERACVAALRYLVSPMHTLPVELLAGIFDLAIRDYNYVQDVLLISQVCSDWRQVAHTTPRLWTGLIHVHLRGQRGHGEQLYVDGLKAWLARSAPLTLPVCLELDHRHSIHHHMTDELLSTTPRWRSLQFTSPYYSPLSSVRRLAESSLDNLEELDMGSKDFSEDDDVDPTVPTLFTIVPRLRKFSMNIYSNALPILVPWSQLTDLKLGSEAPEIILNILARCPHLIHANFSSMGQAVFPKAREDILALSHLRTLHLDFSESMDHGISLLNLLAAPALQDLYLVCRIDVASWSQTRFTAFQLRAPNITQIELRHSDLTSDDLRAVIQHAPSLTRLKLRSCYSCFDDALINVLYYEYTDARPLVPHLHTLVLDYIGNNFTEHILAGMIASRWWTDAELASRIDPPAVARWKSVALYGLGDHCRKLLSLPSDVLIYYG
ncbi:hypothetical protein C8R45DRAFT_961974 [Mycena sanguinolenta]|nr:hypothetical protein C8R45DRAFT_961974 [Mycena sanguinolenta]